MITIKHTHEDGTLVYGTSKGDGVYELIGPRTPARFAYMPSIRMIGIRQSRDHLAKRYQIEEARKALEAAGYEVTVEIDDTPRDVTQVKADRADRLDDRRDRLEARAARNMGEAEARSNAAHQISERFAGGQPILVGHHSERRARADHKRMDGHQRAAIAAAGKAEEAARAASVVGAADAYRERPTVIIRRIAKTEADLRRVERDMAGEPPPAHRRYYSSERTPATGAYLEQLQARKAFLEHQLAADRAALDEHKANGFQQHSSETIHAGDLVTYWRAERAEVAKVNRKTVSIPNRYGWHDNVPYDEIRRVECPHEGATTTPAAPVPAKVPAKPAGDNGLAERLAAFKASGGLDKIEPLTVDGSTEFFPTPRAVAVQMIDVAGVDTGMTVLEPSAGLGAIACQVAPFVASVDCIERDRQLAGRLRATGVGDVRCADFLEISPAAVYDRVLMNPPFRNQADIRHVTHALRFVKPGGLLVAVMSGGVGFRQDKTTEQFRALIAEHGGRIERLPDDAFAQSGTSVRTVLVTIPVPAEQAAPEPAPAPTPVPAGPLCQPSLFDEETAA